MPEHAGEKTEQATPRRLEEALKKGQFARSAEVQTVFVLCAGLTGKRRRQHAAPADPQHVSTCGGHRSSLPWA